MKSFREVFYQKIENSIKNRYGEENHDEFRFGPFQNKFNVKISLKQRMIWFLKDLLDYHPEYDQYLKMGHEFICKYEEDIRYYWKFLNEKDRELVASLMTFRLLGPERVKLSRNNKAYREALMVSRSLADYNDGYDPRFLHFKLYKFDLKPIGYDINFYFSEARVAVDFILEQYAYKINGKPIIQAEFGDTVLDLGGCWGDTALYFAHKVGESGTVYSFEFIPNNIKLFNINTRLNPNLNSRIELIKLPVTHESDNTVYFLDNGPASKVSDKSFNGQTGSTKTVSIDDFVKSNDIKQVDFIKMDIEGAEQSALNGAIETIKRFKPKLAIAIYHNLGDFSKIPRLLLDLDYDIFIDHFTIHSEETVCFGRPRSKV